MRCPGRGGGAPTGQGAVTMTGEGGNVGWGGRGSGATTVASTNEASLECVCVGGGGGCPSGYSHHISIILLTRL